MVGETKLAVVGQLQKGDYIVVDGVACRITETNISKPGKHGSTKMNLFAVGLVDDRKRNLVMPAQGEVEVPVVGKRSAQILSITEKQANVMDMENYETFDMSIPEDLQASLKIGDEILYWEILADRVMKQIKLKE
jgi:translation initiation factor 5A